ncbi:MAG: ATP-binding protein [Balneola sp.]
MKWLSLILIFSFLLLAGRDKPLYAQPTSTDWLQHQPVIIEVFDQTDGLPVISLTDIVQGADGYLYIASSGGVSRFDGSDFEQISTQQYPQLNSNRILFLHATPDSSVWMVDEQFFFSRWKEGNLFTFDSLFASTAHSEWDMKTSKEGDVWIFSEQEARVFKNESFVKKHEFLSNQYIDLLPVSGNQVFALSDEGLMELKDNSAALRIPVERLPFSKAEQGAFNRETKMAHLSGNRIAIADFTGVAIYNFLTQEYRFIPYPSHISSSPQSILEKTPSLLLLHTLQGHYELDLSTGEYALFEGTKDEDIWSSTYNPVWLDKPLYISESSVNYNGITIFETQNAERIAQASHDKEGNLWLNVASKGLVRLAISPFSVLSTKNILQSDNTYSIVEDNDKNIWLSSFEFGIHRISDTTIDYWSPQNGGLPNNLAWSLYERKNGNLIAGFWDTGLFQFDGEEWNPFILNDTLLLDQAESFYENNDGDFWIGSRLGLYKKNAGTNRFSEIYTETGEPILRTQVIQPDPGKKLWLGTHGSGLLSADEGKVNAVVFENLSPQPKIRDLFFSSVDTLWLATETYGLGRAILNKTGSIQSYKFLTQTDGLPDIGVHRIIPDPHGFFWLSSNQGISRINTASLNSYLENETPEIWIEVFTEADGLPIREANGGTQSNGLIASDSTIWIPTQKGVVLFNPASFLNRNPFEHTSINLSSIKTEDNEYQIFREKEVDLKRGERSLTLNFELVHFTNPDEVDIEYRISSLRDSWNVLSKDKQLSITNLPPGIHHIELKIAGLPRALNSGDSFSLNTPYYFYERTWFYILVAGFISLGIIALFYSTARAAEKREQRLNLRVEERTRLLNEQKNETDKALKTIQKQARELEQLNEVKTDFFINMTHELRTPLSLIKGPLHLLQDTSRRDDIDQQEQLALIEKNSAHLTNVVDQLLDLLRLEGDISSTQYKKIELVSFVRTQASQFLSSDSLTAKDFKLPDSEKEHFIISDPEACSLIINNLVTNAIKYTEEHDLIELKVYAEKEYTVLEVIDTGIGISEQEIQFIFDPFFRAGNALDQRGSGVGLSIVKNFIDRLGGKVILESKLGEGTSIRIYFPKPKPSELHEAEPYYNSQLLSHKKVKQISKELIDHNLSKVNQNKEPDDEDSEATILLVEDNEDLQLFMTRLLENKHKLHVVNNGVEALEFLKKHTPKLVITDLMMPKMDGIHFIKQMRLNASSSTIPVVVLSAKKTERSITEGLSSGAQVYLTKPVENTILIAQIDSLLEREERLNSGIRSATLNSEVPKNELQISIDELILRHISDPNLTVQSIADTLHISRPTLYRKWKETSDVSLNEYIIKTRLSETIKLIKEKKYTFAEASVVCGFSEPSYFSRVFKKHYDLTPSQYFAQIKSSN